MRLAGLNVPELDREIARGGGEDVLGGGVEEDLSDLSTEELARAWDKRRGAESRGSYLEWPESFATGPTSGISSASTWRVKSLGTCQMKILPSSEPEATISSLKGFLPTVPG